MTGLKMLAVLREMIEETQEPPSNTFTYAMLAEMARIAGLSARNSPPRMILDTWLYIANEYYKLGHYLFSQKYFGNVTETFLQCADSITGDKSIKSKVTGGFANLLDIYTKMGKDEAAKELLALVKEYMPSALAEIQKPKSVFLSVDPVEYTEPYMTILPELEEKVEAALIGESQNSDIYCFLYWQKKEELLERDYGIAWESPIALNPGVMFN